MMPPFDSHPKLRSSSPTARPLLRILVRADRVSPHPRRMLPEPLGAPKPSPRLAHPAVRIFPLLPLAPLLPFVHPRSSSTPTANRL